MPELGYIKVWHSDAVEKWHNSLILENILLQNRM